ncbi:MAG: sulfurtransferase TusA family protein, partial [Brevundimonas sp.]|nr:sulfurtransferase TusA family protein [Brevundimonas sp.]
SLKLRKAIRGAAPGARLTLLATDPMARIDVPHLMAELGGGVVSIDDVDGVLTIVVATPAVQQG